MLHQSCLINELQKYDKLVRRINFFEKTYKLNCCVIPTFISVLVGILSVFEDTVYFNTHSCGSKVDIFAYSMVTHLVRTCGPKLKKTWEIIIWNKYENNTMNVSAL